MKRKVINMKKRMIYGDKSPEERELLRAESRARFAEIYKKTLEVLEASENDFPCGEGFERCWKDIIKVWNDSESLLGSKVLAFAVYHIAWKTWPISVESKPLLELLCLVEKALLEEGYAYEVWSRQNEFNVAINALRLSTDYDYDRCYCRTRCFGRYIYAKAVCQIKLKDRDPKHLDARKSWTDFQMFGTLSELRERVDLFESAIVQLIPEAKGWTAEKWTDETMLLERIEEAHGVDYTQKHQDFDRLINVFKEKLAGKAYDRDLMLLHQFPASLARCLWPKDTEKNLARFFARICKRTSKQEKKNSRYESAFRRTVVMNSWIYKQYEDGTWPSSKEIKRCKFNLALGI